MRLVRRMVGAGVVTLVLAASAAVTAPAAWSHGYVGGQDSGLTARAALRANTGLGAAQWEPQSIEGPKGFPEAGPPDGQIASAGNARFSELDEQSADRWVTTPISPGRTTVAWTYTAPHRTAGWDYFMTTPGWDPDQPLARSSFEKIAGFTHDGGLPSARDAHVLDIPADRTGYHVILAVWEVADTANAFYSVIDVDVEGDPVEPGDPAEPPAAPGRPVASAVGADRVTLTWPASPGAAEVAGYEVHRDGELVTTTAASSWTDRGLRPATEYGYAVRAVDRNGNLSDMSPELRVTTGVDGPAGLTPPTGLHSMGTTAHGVDLMWGAAAGGSGDLVYSVRRSIGLTELVEVGRTSGTRFQDTGLTPRTAYRYVVVAIDANGDTASSAELRLLTPADPGTGAHPAWDVRGTYAVGDRVLHEGRVYECIQAYRGAGDPNWILAPSLWRVVR